MAQQITAPFGAWKSPIRAELMVASYVGLSFPRWVRADLFWTEMRPGEGGRSTVARRTPDGSIQDLVPAPFNVRSRVHEYGGLSYAVHGERVYFSNFSDQRVYHCEFGAAPEPLTPADDRRYADFEVDADRRRLLAVQEDHSQSGGSPARVINRLVAISMDDGKIQVLAEGSDFYAYPRLSPDGERIAYLTWNHPNLPWDDTELWVADVSPDGSLANPQRVAGGEESQFQPQWSPDGVLYFISDRGNWWNIYRWRGGQVEPVTAMQVELGAPLWNLGMATYGFDGPGRIICTYVQQGENHLALIDLVSGNLSPIELDYNFYSEPVVSAGKLAVVAGSPTRMAELVLIDLSSRQVTEIKRSSQVTVAPGYLSIAQPVSFPTENGQTAYGFFYPPRNQDYSALQGEKPPLLVLSHGGPTGRTVGMLNLGLQIWTSRGFAVLDVNYRGSSGYGRAFRQQLYGQWGVVDVDDCVNGARYLVAQGLVDGKRLAIRGGSAGGYTTLCALTFRDEYQAGASHFGIGELEVFVTDTHKFESRYLDQLIGPYPERKDLYYQRSPINFVEQINCPVILFQGLDDRVVPPNQAQMMFDSLKARGIPVAYLPFEGEGHGFRQAKNIIRAVEAELYFYGKVFGFEPADAVEPVSIENL